MDRLRGLDLKLTEAIEKVKNLKAEKSALEKRLKTLEDSIHLKDLEIDSLRHEKTSIKGQIEELLGEIEAIQIN